MFNNVPSLPAYSQFLENCRGATASYRCDQLQGLSETIQEIVKRSPYALCKESFCSLRINHDEAIRFAYEKPKPQDACSFNINSTHTDSKLAIEFTERLHKMQVTHDGNSLEASTDFASQLSISRQQRVDGKDVKSGLSFKQDPSSGEVLIAFYVGETRISGICKAPNNKLTCSFSNDKFPFISKTVEAELFPVTTDASGKVTFKITIHSLPILPFFKPESLGSFSLNFDPDEEKVSAQGNLKNLDGSPLIGGKFSCINSKVCEGEAKLSWEPYEESVDFQIEPSKYNMTLSSNVKWNDDPAVKFTNDPPISLEGLPKRDVVNLVIQPQIDQTGRGSIATTLQYKSDFFKGISRLCLLHEGKETPECRVSAEKASSILDGKFDVLLQDDLQKIEASLAESGAEEGRLSLIASHRSAGKIDEYLAEGKLFSAEDNLLIGRTALGATFSENKLDYHAELLSQTSGRPAVYKLSGSLVSETPDQPFAYKSTESHDS